MCVGRRGEHRPPGLTAAERRAAHSLPNCLPLHVMHRYTRAASSSLAAHPASPPRLPTRSLSSTPPRGNCRGCLPVKAILLLLPSKECLFLLLKKARPSRGNAPAVSPSAIPRARASCGLTRSAPPGASPCTPTSACVGVERLTKVWFKFSTASWSDGEVFNFWSAEVDGAQAKTFVTLQCQRRAAVLPQPHEHLQLPVFSRPRAQSTTQRSTLLAKPRHHSNVAARSGKCRGASTSPQVNANGSAGRYRRQRRCGPLSPCRRRRRKAFGCYPDDDDDADEHPSPW
jgi:hypothetical protein